MQTRQTKSKLLVQSLMAFRSTIRSARFQSEVRHRFGNYRSLNAICRSVIPDAYEFHEKLQILTLIEVIDSNPISAAKGEMIGRLGECLYAKTGWTVSVAIYDSCGGLIDELPSLAFMPCYTSRFEDQRDARNIVPAARAVYRELKKDEGREVDQASLQAAVASLDRLFLAKTMSGNAAA